MYEHIYEIRFFLHRSFSLVLVDNSAASLTPSTSSPFDVDNKQFGRQTHHISNNRICTFIKYPEEIIRSERGSLALMVAEV